MLRLFGESSCGFTISARSFGLNGLQSSFMLMRIIGGKEIVERAAADCSQEKHQRIGESDLEESPELLPVDCFEGELEGSLLRQEEHPCGTHVDPLAQGCGKAHSCDSFLEYCGENQIQDGISSVEM